MNPEIFTELTLSAMQGGVNRQVIGAAIVKDDKILVIRRKQDDFMGGIYELPGGKVENESLEECIIREIREETNLDVSKINKYLNSFDYLSKSGKKTRQFNFEVAASGDIKLSEEHDDYKWITKEEIDQLNITEEIKKVIKLI